MFNLKNASRDIRNAAAHAGIKSGEFEPVNAGQTIESLPDDAVVARAFNRNFPDGVEITAWDVRYAQQYFV